MTTYERLADLRRQWRQTVDERDEAYLRLRQAIEQQPPDQDAVEQAQTRYDQAERDERITGRQLQQTLRATIRNLDPTVPLLLLPVRLETRYEPAPSTRLRVRIYPDDIHRTLHEPEPELTEAEAQAGHEFWRACWKAAPNDQRRAWTLLVAAVGPQRAAWVVRVLRPGNRRTDPEPQFPPYTKRDALWTRPERAELLPDCWYVEAWRGDVPIATATGGLIDRPLDVGPDPMSGGDDLVDPGMRWMTDFDAAVDVGMGLTIDLPDRDKVDLLLVFGVRGTEPPGTGPAAVARLIDAHRYGVGDTFALVPAGTPTNNSAASRSGQDEPSFTDPFRAAPAPWPAGDAHRLAVAFGLPPETLAELPGAYLAQAEFERRMATALWPATWGYYLTQLLRFDQFNYDGPGWRRWILDRVHAGGPLPAVRAGRQPYGILPVTSLRRWRPSTAASAGLVSVELVQQPGGEVVTEIRVAGGFRPTRGWSFREPRTFTLPTPPDAHLVAAATLVRPGEDMRLVMTRATATGLRCDVISLDDDGPGAITEIPVDLPLPADRPRGVAVAVGRLARFPADLVLVAQYPGTILMTVAARFTGTEVTQWSAPREITAHFDPAERVTSAALLTRPDGGADLIVVTEDETAPPETQRARWHVAHRLNANGQARSWDGPVPVGPTHVDGPGRSAGTAVTIAEGNDDGMPAAMLTTFHIDPDGIAPSYVTGFDPVDGYFTWPADWRQSLHDRLSEHILLSGAATWVPWTPFREPDPGLASGPQQVNLLGKLLDQWQAAAAQVRRLRPDDKDPDRTLLDILATDAVSASVEARPFVGTAVQEHVWRALNQPQPSATATDAVTALLTPLNIHLPHPARLGLGGYTSVTNPVPDDMVGDFSNLAKTMAEATPHELHDNWIGPHVPLLVRLIRHSLLQAYADAAFAMVPISTSTPVPPALPEPELVDLFDFGSPDPGERFTLTSWRHLATAQLGSRPVAEELHRLARTPEPPIEVRPLAETIEAIRGLEGLPADELARLLGGVLDLASHRLDAWVTAVATQRLDEMRTSTPAGLHIAAYGFVRDLEPATGPASTGYIHAPSVSHAATAAVLRSGHHTHPGGQFAVNLLSRRVRAALDVLGALRQGQSLGAALGYRFDRELYDLGVPEYLAAVRQLVPLEIGLLTPLPPDTAVTTVSVLTTTDGLALLDLDVPWGTTPPGQTQPLPTEDSPEGETLAAAINRVRDVADAIADIGIAESVHQLLHRNPIRAAGTLDALTRGEVPASDDPDILRTPRHGTGVTHRVLVVAPDPASPVAAEALGKWPATQQQRTRHARAVAEPRINAWAALVLGNPARVRYRVDRGAGAAPAEFTLDAVGLCPWDVLAAPPSAVANLAETNLGRRLLRHAASELGQTDPLTLVTERDAGWGPDVLSLPELLTLAESGRTLVTARRAAHGGDLRGGEGGPAGTDTVALAGRAAQARTGLQTATDELRTFFTLGAPERGALAVLFPGLDVTGLDNLLDLPAYCDAGRAAGAVARPAMPAADLIDCLDRLAGFGLPDAAARPATADAESDQAALAVQSRAVHTEAVRRRLASAKASADGNDAAAVETVFGAGFRVLPLFEPGPHGGVTPQGAPAEVVERWLEDAARVRVGAARLRDVLLGSEVAGGTPAGWDVLQLPGTGPDRWVGEPPDPAGDGIPAGCVSVVACTTDDGWQAGPTAALLVDAWVEVVPAAEIDTAVAFQVDVPDACAPQTLLLAVPPDLGRRWTWPILSSVLRETVALADVRAVDRDLVPAYGHLLPALYLTHNVGGDPGGDTVATRFED